MERDELIETSNVAAFFRSSSLRDTFLAKEKLHSTHMHHWLFPPNALPAEVKAAVVLALQLLHLSFECIFIYSIISNIDWEYIPAIR
jgi:uncharacterized membrane protein YbaN (DUF454 family)